VGKAVRGALDGADDLVDLDRFERPVALADMHNGRLLTRRKSRREVGESGLSWSGIGYGGHG